MWSLTADYYFDNVTGILLAENLHFHRFEFKPLRPLYQMHEDFYINRTLAMVNSMIIMDSYEKIGGLADPGLEDLYIWLISLAVIIPCAAITIILLRKHFFRRN